MIWNCEKAKAKKQNKDTSAGMNIDFRFSIFFAYLTLDGK